jgi:hypothetical protein
LLNRLQISQATFSRTIQSLDADVLRFREPGIRTPRYALVRSDPVASPQAVFQVSEDGRVTDIGSVNFLRGGAAWVDLGGTDSRLHEGLPPAMAFAAPSGYLGSRIVQAVSSDLGVPASLRD